MNIPSKKESIAYFSDLGYTLEWTESLYVGYDMVWRLSHLQIKESYDEFATLPELWLRMMKRAQHLINQDNAYHAFVAEYKKGSPQRKKELEKWVEATVKGSSSPDDSSFTHHLTKTIDHLPRNWKRKFHDILSHSEMSIPFPHRALKYLKALGNIDNNL